mmetsp:Transcript_18575/g.30188  ORF Transcript_18575/g.30188 Transcript_18575/m.30188 type:complete len:581 (+) Transcript_18575:107-1849(+)
MRYSTLEKGSDGGVENKTTINNVGETNGDSLVINGANDESLALAAAKKGNIFYFLWSSLSAWQRCVFICAFAFGMLSMLGVGILIGLAAREDDAAQDGCNHPLEPARGWLLERLWHTTPVFCKEGEENEGACGQRIGRLDEIRRNISSCKHPLAFNLRTYAHRGAALVAPEESLMGYKIAKESGAGFIECDASVTKDGELVCRHSTCDLHFTTDIIENHRNMLSRCSVPFQPSVNGSDAQLMCCTYDFPLDELKKLCGIMESTMNTSATTLDQFLLGPPGFRSNPLPSYGDPTSCQNLVAFREYLKYARKEGLNVIPELKDTGEPRVERFLRRELETDIYALANEFSRQILDHGFEPKVEETDWNNVGKYGGITIMQTFDRRIASHWKRHESSADIRVEFMWKSYRPKSVTNLTCTSLSDCGTFDILSGLAADGVDIFGPPIRLLVQNSSHHILEKSSAAEAYTNLIRSSSKRNKGREEGGATASMFPALTSWSLERSGCDVERSSSSSSSASDLYSPQVQPAQIGPCGYYYDSVENAAVFSEPDVLLVLDVLFREVGIIGLFSDFPASVSTFVNCVLDK